MLRTPLPVVLVVALAFSPASAEEGNLFALGEALGSPSMGLSPSALFEEARVSSSLAPTTLFSGTSLAGGLFGESGPDLTLSAAVGWHAGGEMIAQMGPLKEKVDVEDGVIGKLMADLFLTKHFGIGFYGQIAGSEIDATDGPDIVMYEVGLSLKLRLSLGEKFFVKPHFDLGYRRIDVDEIPTDVEGLAANVGVALGMHVGVAEVFVEPGFICMPIGRLTEEGAVATFHPIFTIMAGAGLSF